MRMKIRMFFIILLIWPFLIFAQEADFFSPRIREAQAGIFCAPEIITTVPSPDTVSGESNIMKYEPEFISHSRNVPAVLGMGFGLKIMASEYDIHDVVTTATHPPMGPEGVTKQTFNTSWISSTDLSFMLYQFDYDYEMVQGPWTLNAWDGETLLFQAHFNVVSPQMVPELASACGYEDLLS